MWRYSLVQYEICKNCMNLIHSGLDTYRCYTIAELYGLRSTYSIVRPYNIACKSYDNNRMVDDVEV